jgi:ribonuclease P protein component
VRPAEVRAVLDRARPLHGDRVILFLAPGSGRVAAVAGRVVGGAVERNRARRVLRAAWRAVEPRVAPNHDVVLVARRGIRGAKAQDLVTEVGELIERAGAGR